MSNQIDNIVFDLGNVLVRWSPVEITRLVLGDTTPDLETRARELFAGETWGKLNLGVIDDEQAKKHFMQEAGLTSFQVEALFYYVKATQIPIYASMDLLRRVKASGYKIYALSDNIHSIVAFLKTTYDFWHLFDGAIISAQEGVMKPSLEIYTRLCERYDLMPENTLFLDDIEANVLGAREAGINAFQFENALETEVMLAKYGVSLIAQ